MEAANQGLGRAGIGWSDVSAVELNEAFAVQSLTCIDAWGTDSELVNTKGVRLPLVIPWARLADGSSPPSPRGLVEQRSRCGVAAICIGVGQALAVVLENVA